MSSATASMSSGNSCVTPRNRRSPPDAYARSTAGSLGPNRVPWCRDPLSAPARVPRHLVGCCRRLNSTFYVPGPCTWLSDVERAGSQERGTATPMPPQVWWPPTQTSARRCNTLRETTDARNLPRTCHCTTLRCSAGSARFWTFSLTSGLGAVGSPDTGALGGLVVAPSTPFLTDQRVSGNCN
jgi:hypothetical protein